MTPKQKLQVVETTIRKALPRLMEVRRGCILKNSNVWVRLLSDKGDYYEVMGWDTIYQELKKEWLPEYEIIGHDILLSDVLEWLNSSETRDLLNKKTSNLDTTFEYVYVNGGNITLVYHRSDGGISLATRTGNWDLSKPLLADQSEVLWEFLYNLLEDNE